MKYDLSCANQYLLSLEDHCQPCSNDKSQCSDVRLEFFNL